jgi:signal transduction histidine kinase
MREVDGQTPLQAVESFFTTKGSGKGTGLGLPMVLRLAEQPHGKLTLALWRVFPTR